MTRLFSSILVLFMSVTDPLIKELKGHALQLLESPKPVTDENGIVSNFCECLEKIFYRGVLPLKNAIGFVKSPECWHWLEFVANEKHRSPYSFISSVHSSKKSVKVTTYRGRTRLLIRTALVNRCLHVPVQILINEKLFKTYYNARSIVGDEILAQLFLSVLLLIARIEFKLDLNAARFLDDTWAIPHVKNLQLVPCSQLGVSVVFVSGKAVVIDVLPFSVAAENDCIQVGDVLDDLNGVCITDNLQGTLGNVMRKATGLPVSVYVIKAEWEGSLFPSIIPLLHQAGLDPAVIAARHTEPPNSSSLACDVEITYLGSVETGSRNDIKQISLAIDQKLNEEEKVTERVIFQYHDLGLRVLSHSNGEVLMNHSYMEVSSCGCTTSTPHYFAYISGDENFSECKNFTCHIFHCNNGDEIEALLRNLGQGFKRTHCAV